MHLRFAWTASELIWRVIFAEVPAADNAKNAGIRWVVRQGLLNHPSVFRIQHGQLSRLDRGPGSFNDFFIG